MLGHAQGFIGPVDQGRLLAAAFILEQDGELFTRPEHVVPSYVHDAAKLAARLLIERGLLIVVV